MWAAATAKPRSAVFATWAAYTRAMETNPIRTSFCTGAGLWATGNLLVQWVIEPAMQKNKNIGNHQQQEQHKDFEFGRMIGSFLFGGCFSGIGCCAWYEWLDKKWRAMPRIVGQPGSPRFIATKLMFDCGVFLPVELVAFFYFLGAFEQKSAAQCWQDTTEGFYEGVIVESAIWIPVQTANFKFVPVRLQVLIVNLACLLEAVLMSVVQGARAKEDDEEAEHGTTTTTTATLAAAPVATTTTNQVAVLVN